MENSYERKAKVFKALCDPNRLMVIEMLQSGEKCACKILENLNVTQSTLSHHMKILCESGLVDSRRDGKWMHYDLNKQGFETALTELLSLTPKAVWSDENQDLTRTTAPVQKGVATIICQK